jgi:predicted secreted acid phosphatase
MHKTIRSIALCALLGTTCAIAAPQEAQNDSKQVNREATMQERLALTADQKAQFRAILQSRHDQAASIKNDASLSPSTRKEKLKAVRLDTDTKIRGLLNENQLAEYEQILKERREKAVRNRETALPPQ